MKIENGRMDISSRKSFPSVMLFRLVKIDNLLILDESHNVKGRGIYLLKDLDAIKTARKKKLLERYCSSLEANELYDKLEGLL